MKRTLVHELENQDSRSNTLPLTKCVNLGKSLNLIDPQFLNLERKRQSHDVTVWGPGSQIPKTNNLK